MIDNNRFRDAVGGAFQGKTPFSNFRADELQQFNDNLKYAINENADNPPFDRLLKQDLSRDEIGVLNQVAKGLANHIA